MERKRECDAIESQNERVICQLQENAIKYKKQEVSYLLISITFIIIGLVSIVSIPFLPLNPNEKVIKELTHSVSATVEKENYKEADVLLKRLSRLELTQKISETVLRLTILIVMFFLARIFLKLQAYNTKRIGLNKSLEQILILHPEPIDISTLSELFVKDQFENKENLSKDEALSILSSLLKTLPTKWS